MPLKVLLFFRKSGDGWSELYYKDGNDPDQVTEEIESIVPNAGNNASVGGMITLRLKMLHPTCSLVHVRVGVDGAFRQEDAITVPAAIFKGQYVSPAQLAQPNALDTQLSLLLRYVGKDANNQLHHRNLFIGGLPADQIVGDTYSPTANWSGANGVLTNFINAIKVNPWRMKARPDLQAPGNLPKPITSFTVSADGTIAYVTPDVIAPLNPPPTTVILRGIKVPRGWNGTHSALSVAAPPPGVGTVVQIGPLRRAGVTAPLWNTRPTGTIQPNVPTYFVPEAIHDEEIVERKRGRFFGQPRGRRSS